MPRTKVTGWWNIQTVMNCSQLAANSSALLSTGSESSISSSLTDEVQRFAANRDVLARYALIIICSKSLSIPLPIATVKRFMMLILTRYRASRNRLKPIKHQSSDYSLPSPVFPNCRNFRCNT